MKLKYESGPAALIVPGIGEVERGKSVDIDDKEQAKRLLAQGWTEVHSHSPSHSHKAASKEATTEKEKK